MAPSKFQLKKDDADIVEPLLPSIPESAVLEVGANNGRWEITHGGISGGVTISIYCKIGEGSMKSLAVSRDSDKIFLAGINAVDEHQKWDLLNTTYGSSINRDEHANFALVNRATGLALWRSSTGEGEYCNNLSLMKFEGRYMDESALWKEGRFAKHGLRRIYAGDKDYCYYLNVDDANNVLLRKDERRFPLKFGGSSGKMWKIVRHA